MRDADVESLVEAERSTAEFVRKFHLSATLMGFKVRRDDSTLPAFAVLRFPARRKAVILAGCTYLGHDCGRGKQVLPVDEVTRAALVIHARGLLAAAQKELAADGFEVSVLWECSRMTFARAAGYLWARMPSRRNKIRPRTFPGPEHRIHSPAGG